MQATEWLELVDRTLVELRIRKDSIELEFGELALCLRGAWKLLDPSEVQLESGEGGELGRTTHLHRLVGARPAAWRFATESEVALLFSSGHTLMIVKSGAEISR